MKTNMAGNSFLLFLTACIWGVAFVAQSVGMDYVEPFTFNAVRFFLGAAVLLPFLVAQGRKASEKRAKKQAGQWKVTAAGGICCGLALCSASLFQQFGIRHTTVGKAGFITALYIIIVPILGLFFKRRVRPLVWGSAGLAALGLYLLCVKESFSLNKGDALMLVCAFLFSIHILIIDYFSPKADGVHLSCVQFFVSAILCTIGAFLFENPSWQAILSGWQPILYAGILSCGVAYTLQIVGQKNMDPTVASLILSLESVISVLAGWVILGQALNRKEVAGCVLVFVAIIIVQLPEKRSFRQFLPGGDMRSF